MIRKSEKTSVTSDFNTVPSKKLPVSELFTCVVNCLNAPNRPISDTSSSTFFIDRSRLAGGVRRQTSTKAVTDGVVTRNLLPEIGVYDQSIKALRSQIESALEADTRGTGSITESRQIRRREPPDDSASTGHSKSGPTSRRPSPSRLLAARAGLPTLLNQRDHNILESRSHKSIFGSDKYLKPLILSKESHSTLLQVTKSTYLGDDMKPCEPSSEFLDNTASLLRLNDRQAPQLRIQNDFSRPDSLAQLHGLPSMLAAESSYSKLKVSIGCHRSVEDILARADERCKRQTSVSHRREKSDHKELEALCRSIEERETREERKVMSKDMRTRRHFWSTIISISSAFQKVGGGLEEQLCRHRCLEREVGAALLIARYLVMRRARRAYLANLSIVKSYETISILFSSVIRRWLLRRAAERLKDFLLSCLSCTSQGFSAMYVLRFAMAVRRVQAAARQFMARNRARIKSLERTWDAYEYHYISATVKAMQKASKSHPPAAYSVNNASSTNTNTHLNPPKGSSPSPTHTSTMTTLALSHSHSHTNSGGGASSALPHTNANANSSQNTYLLRMKTLLEQRRSVIDLKIRRYTGYQFEKENLMVYHLTKASRTACLLKVVHDARQVLSLRYKESVLLLQLAEAEKTKYYMEDALSLLRTDSDPFLHSMAKCKMEAAGKGSRSVYSSNAIATKKKLALLYYNLILEDSAVWKCVREAHEKNKTFERIQRDHVGCI